METCSHSEITPTQNKGERKEPESERVVFSLFILLPPDGWMDGWMDGRMCGYLARSAGLCLGPSPMDMEMSWPCSCFVWVASFHCRPGWQTCQSRPLCCHVTLCPPCASSLMTQYKTRSRGYTTGIFHVLVTMPCLSSLSWL